MYIHIVNDANMYMICAKSSDRNSFRITFTITLRYDIQIELCSLTINNLFCLHVI